MRLLYRSPHALRFTKASCSFAIYEEVHEDLEMLKHASHSQGNETLPLLHITLREIKHA